jgi:hypothetical protein
MGIGVFPGQPSAAIDFSANQWMQGWIKVFDHARFDH